MQNFYIKRCVIIGILLVIVPVLGIADNTIGPDNSPSILGAANSLLDSDIIIGVLIGLLLGAVRGIQQIIQGVAAFFSPRRWDKRW
jgi:hypothetical protein